jgi:hypothetical protein
MVNYITAIEKNNNQYVALAKNPENNTVIYSSRPYDTLPAAMQDVKMFLEGVRLGTQSRNYSGYQPPPISVAPTSPDPNAGFIPPPRQPCSTCPGSR